MIDIKKALAKKVYIQRAVGTPFLIQSAAYSGFAMKKKIGFGYTYFVFTFKHDYLSMRYLVKDLEDLREELDVKLKQEPDYFIKSKQRYDKDVKRFLDSLKHVDSLDIKSLKDEELLSLMNETYFDYAGSIGIGHIIEAFALTADDQIKSELGKYVKDASELNKAFTILTSPVKKSYLNEFEETLRKISKTKDENLIQDTIKRFYWIKNSYAGRKPLTKDEILKDSASLKEPFDIDKVVKQKTNLIQKLNLDKELLAKIKAVEFLTSWQDERKMHLMIGVDYLDRLLHELSRRLKFDIEYLRYMLPQDLEMDKLKTKEFQQELKQRREGCVNYMALDTFFSYSGGEYPDLIEAIDKENISDVKEINGTTASLGTAVGRVKILTTLESMSKVEEGDIIVTSMTRPELVPAMRKAAAVITDEGGITCHAAIVSRELGIPCIIGTKTATKVLKDGDLVEVKANHGVVVRLGK